MRLEHLCDLELIYREQPPTEDKFVLIQPYASGGSGYGELDGTVSGDTIRGTVRCVNHPRQRGDGMMLPDAHGVLRTDDGALVLFSLTGRTLFEHDTGKQLLTAVFETADQRYALLNQTWCVLEGVIDGIRLGMHARIYQCIHELSS
jgi:hypothetical protein